MKLEVTCDNNFCRNWGSRRLFNFVLFLLHLFLVLKILLFSVLTPCRLRNEEGNSMFLRNVCIFLRVYEASKPRTTWPSSLPWDFFSYSVFPSLLSSLISYSSPYSAILPTICISRTCYTIVLASDQQLLRLIRLLWASQHVRYLEAPEFICTAL